LRSGTIRDTPCASFFPRAAMRSQSTRHTTIAGAPSAPPSGINQGGTLRALHQRYLGCSSTAVRPDAGAIGDSITIARPHFAASISLAGRFRSESSSRVAGVSGAKGGREGSLGSCPTEIQPSIVLDTRRLSEVCCREGGGRDGCKEL